MTKSFSRFVKETREKKIVVGFCDFDSPSLIYDKLFEKVSSLSDKGDYRIYTKSKGKLSLNERIRYMRKIYPSHARQIVSDKGIQNKNVLIEKLELQGYDKITIVEPNSQNQNLSESVSVINCGKIDNEKMIESVQNENADTYFSKLPKEFENKTKLFNDLRESMGLSKLEERPHIQLPPVSKTREKYIEGQLLKERDDVKILSSNETGFVTYCGTNYVIVEKDNGGHGRFWLEDVQLLERKVAQDKEIKDREGTQPKKYYSGLKTKSTKDSRARHFEKGAEMDDDDPKAYEPAPGDATAKTKPSKHTKKYDQMFGEENIQEGVYDPAIFKAIFMAGGPGSGKSFVVQNAALTALGFKVVNSDEKFEYLLKKAGMKTTPEDIMSPKGQKIRGNAKKLTNTSQDLWIDGRLGLVIDGTGKDYNKIKKQADALKKLGYEVGMIFVNTNLKTAIERDQQRPRNLGPELVTKMWNEVQDNIGKFQSFFGDNFVVVDNSTGSDFDNIIKRTYKKFMKFSKSEPKNPIAKKWIKSQLNESVLYEQNPEKAIKNKAKETGVDYKILKKVFDRGVAAWRTGHRPGTTAVQWGLARINSFVTGGKTQSTADKDLAKEAGLIKENKEGWASHKFKEIYVNRFRNKNEKFNSILFEGKTYKTKNEMIYFLSDMDEQRKSKYRVFKNQNNQIEFKENQ